MFQNLPLPAAQEVHDSSSGVTTCIVMKNDGIVYHQVSCFSPERWMNVVLQERTHRATSILIQERYSSFENMVIRRRTIPMKGNVLHTAVDWQGCVAAGCTPLT